MPNKLGGLHALRGAAILIIVLFHSQGYALAKSGAALTAITPFAADLAVHALFVVSGFVIFWAYSPQLGQPEKVAPYLRKRLVRIFPFYWLMLAAFYAGLILLPAFGRGGELDPATILVSVFLLPSDIDPALYVAWTLKYDLAFWLIFAVAIARPWWGLALGAATILLGALYSPIGLYPLSFAAGCGTAWLARHLALPHLEWPAPLILVGEASFSIYLVHTPAIAAVGLLLPASPALQPLLVVISLGAGLLTYWLVELPVRDLARWPAVSTSAFSPEAR